MPAAALRSDTREQSDHAALLGPRAGRSTLRPEPHSRMPRLVTVNDRMQQGYRYVLTGADRAATSIRTSGPS